jgi:hypothetical protein
MSTSVYLCVLANTCKVFPNSHVKFSITQRNIPLESFAIIKLPSVKAFDLVHKIIDKTARAVYTNTDKSILAVRCSNVDNSKALFAKIKAEIMNLTNIVEMRYVFNMAKFKKDNALAICSLSSE